MLLTNRTQGNAASANAWRIGFGRWVVSLIILLAIPALLGATTWYCSPSGSDSNPGTSSQPFRTVAAGITAANPGDTIVLENGTYPADTPYGGGSTSGYLLMVGKSGTAGAPITLMAQNSQMAILDCGNAYNSAQTGCEGYLSLIGAAYWVFNGLTFANSYDAGVNMNSSTPDHDITFEGCLFENIGQHVESSAYGMDGLYANQGSYNLTFNGNTFSNIGRITAGSTYPFNDHALYLHASNSTVINNVFSGFIAGWGVQTAIGFSGLIANNTFAFTSANDGGQVMLWDVASGAISLENNIFYNPPSGFAVNTCALSASSCTLNTNLVYNGTMSPSESCGGSTVTCSVSNAISANPNFVNATSNFQLQPGSPAINAGMTIPAVTTDINGLARPQGPAYCIGASEYPVAQPPVVAASPKK